VSKPETSFCSEQLRRDLKRFDQRTTLGEKIALIHTTVELVVIIEKVKNTSLSMASGIEREMFSKIHTCNSVPKSEPRRGSAIEAGFNASANSARLTSTSPRILDREVPCFDHGYGERQQTSLISKFFRCLF
jgi:hypothetical protein